MYEKLYTLYVWGASEGHNNNHGYVQLKYVGDTKEFVSAVIEVLTGKLNSGEIYKEEIWKKHKW